MKQFIVFVEPFCEAAWLGALLSYRDYKVLTDISLAMQSTQDFDKLLAEPRRGFVDTNMALLWPEIVERRPDIRMATVHRPRAEIYAAAADMGMAGDEPGLDRLALALREIEGLSGTKAFTHDELLEEKGLRRLFEFCLPYRWDTKWYAFCRELRGGRDLPMNAVQAQHNIQGIQNTFGSAVAYYNSRLRDANS